jgi:capsule polysaccharide modification protein KpsS
MQIQSDTVANLAKIDTVSLLYKLGDISRNLSKIIVVKRHPLCRSRQVSRAIKDVQSRTSVVFCDANIHDLIEYSEAVITVNSGVGAEALLHRKPVITTGGADYMAATLNVDDPEKLNAILSQRQLDVVEPSIEKFVSAYTQKYMVEVGDATSLLLHPAVLQFLRKKI